MSRSITAVVITIVWIISVVIRYHRNCGLQWWQHGRWWRRRIDLFACQRGNVVVHVLHIDRKSTRLNSSHQIISYAVFCLKKKIAEIDRLVETHLHRKSVSYSTLRTSPSSIKTTSTDSSDVHTQR